MRYLSVHHTFGPDEEDQDIMETFTQEVNEAVKALEATPGVEEVRAFAFNTTNTVNDCIVKSADLIFNANTEYIESVDNDGEFGEDTDEGIMPELGTGRRKITEEVFNWIKDRYEEDNWSIKEITESYEGELSTETVRKVINTDDYEGYYKKSVLSN